MERKFNGDEQIIDLVRRFESCEIHPANFRHYQHLTVALWYVHQFPFARASEKMRKGIQKLAAAYGKTGYHETITLFWLIKVRDFAASAESFETMTELANRLVASCADKSLINQYYSEELLASPETKLAWVPPDLKSLSSGEESAPSA